MPQNKTEELAHARKILHNPEFYWNSYTKAGLKGSLRRAEWIKQEAGFSMGKKVLEVGCGTGFFSEIFLQDGINLSSIDISPELLEKARERCGSRADFRLCDIETLPYADATFDAAVGVRVLHHLDLEVSFREIRRTLKPGGVIAFCEPNMMNPQIMIQKNIPIIKRWMGDTPNETAFFKWRLKKFLSIQGFTDIRVEPFDFLHPWIPDSITDVAEKIGFWLEKAPLIREIGGSLRIFARRK